MKISDFGHWFRLYGLTGKYSTILIEAGEFPLLMQRSVETISSDGTHFLRIDYSLNGKHIWQMKADLKSSRWTINVLKNDLVIYSSWCDKSKIIGKLKEVVKSLEANLHGETE
jgi:hypothetical protein